MTQPTGIFTMPAEVYHADPCEVPSLSESIATVLCASSPWHAWTAHPKLNPDFKQKNSDKFDLGRVAHALLLEDRPLEDAVVIVDAPDWRTDAAKDQREEARAAGRTALLAVHVDRVVAMLKATRAQLDAVDTSPELFRAGKPEQTLIWQEEGVTCRALVDWLHDDFLTIDDFKTTSATAEPERWARSTLFSIGADIQAAFYLRGLKATAGKLTPTERELRFVVQETEPPYALSVVGLSPDVLAVGNAKVEYAIDRWRKCIKADKWPGYPRAVCYAELPPWEESRWMEKEMREELAA